MTADQDLSARLHACHFCKTECNELVDVTKAEDQHPIFQVQCVACGVCGPVAPSENVASNLWNLTAPAHERAVQAAVAKAVEAERAGCAEVAINACWSVIGGREVAAAIRSRALAAPVTANEVGV